MLMKKFLLPAAILAAGFLNANAENKAYTSNELGDCNGVSSSGRFVVASDDENNCVYLWDALNPDLFVEITPEMGAPSIPSGQRVNGANAYSVADDGTVVGCLCYADGKSVPAFYKDGKWTKLDLPEQVMNTNQASVITPDAKTIVGFSCHPHKDFDGTYFGQYFPVKWTLDDNGEYAMTSYADIDLLNNDGFIPYCISPDGKTIGGRLSVGVGSTMAALLVDNQVKYFHDVEITSAPFYYAGKWFCGNDENGYQIWTSDPDDPRIVLFEQTKIDGLIDDNGSHGVSGTFVSCDGNGNFYGARSVVRGVKDNGETGTVTKSACVYNSNSGEWYDNADYSAFTCGKGLDMIFTNDNNILLDADPYSLSDFYHVSVPGTSFGAWKCNKDATVLGCVRGELNEAIGEWDYFPYVIVSEDYDMAVKTVYGGLERPSFILSKGSLSVRNAKTASVFDTDGHLIGQGLEFSLAPGAYVVRAGEYSAKVLVR